MEFTDAKIKDIFVDFLKMFKDEKNNPKYREMISQLPSGNKISIAVDYNDLLSYNTEIGTNLIKEPDVYLRAFDEAGIEALSIEDPIYADKKKKELHIRLSNLTDSISLRDVTKANLNTLIMARGMVVRVSELKPMAQVAAFRCTNEHLTFVEQSGTNLKRPVKCETEGCGENKLFELDELRTEFIDFQVIRIQELPEELPPGQLPQVFDVYLMGDIVNTARPGDRIVLTGIVKAESEYSAGAGKLRLFTYRIEGNLVQRYGKTPAQTEISREEEESIKEFAGRPGAYDRLIASVAPAIFGHEIHKEAALLLMVGSNQRPLPDGGTLRGDLNVLLVGDPGTAKSELLKFVSRVAPRALYTSGRGTTAAGLTAAVVREKNGMLMLEAGATVLADQGVAVIDEFDKMRKEDRDALHEVMEQQSYHPSFEISLSDGRRAPIGVFVDHLFSKDRTNTLYGNDCEILPLLEPYEIYTCEVGSGEITRTKIDRVSRHKAPRNFLLVKYSNGREITVTPDHPVFVYRRGAITTVQASELTVQDYAPAPRKVPNSAIPVLLTPQKAQERNLKLPLILDQNLSKLLGYLVSEGHSFSGSSSEIGFSNTNEGYLSEVTSLFDKVFGIKPSIGGIEGVTVLRFISKQLFLWFDQNFPEIMCPARSKRAPKAIRGSSVQVIREFLSGAFLGDGSVESASICYVTASNSLAEDYQDLLHKLGIMSRIVLDSSNRSFKVYITGDSIPSFVENIAEKYDPRHSRLLEFARRSVKLTRAHDSLPPQVAFELVEIMKSLNIRRSNYFHEHVEGHFGVNQNVAQKYFDILGAAVERFEIFSSSDLTSLREARQILGVSQRFLAKICNLKTGQIDYLENGGYKKSSEQRIQRIKLAIKDYVSPIRADLKKLELLLNYRFLRVTQITTVPNSGPFKTNWVYDITVEPSHNFISKGVVLHNTASVAKGGFIATLNARTSILAAANPIFGKYDAYKNILDNINLPVPLLTRFDLVFIVKDEPDAARDEKLAKHILDLHANASYPVTPPLEFDFLKKYIIYVKRLDPELSEEARTRLSSFYIELRRSAEPGQIAVTPRYLEGMIRLSIARARLLLHPRVTEDDALRAVTLMRRMLETVAVDQNIRGKQQIDMGVMYGKPQSERNLLEAALDTFKRLEGDGPSKQPVEDKNFIEELQKTGKFSKEEGARMLQTLYRSGQIYEIKPHFYRKI